MTSQRSTLMMIVANLSNTYTVYDWRLWQSFPWCLTHPFEMGAFSIHIAMLHRRCNVMTVVMVVSIVIGMMSTASSNNAHLPFCYKHIGNAFIAALTASRKAPDYTIVLSQWSVGWHSVRRWFLESRAPPPSLLCQVASASVFIASVTHQEGLVGQNDLNFTSTSIFVFLFWYFMQWK